MTFPDCATTCEWRDAANQNERADGTSIDLLVLHYTGMQSEQGALDWLCCEESRVSCHYFVFSDGRIVQSVPESRRAWHAGISSWRGLGDLNSRSIGIEIANPGHEFGYRPFPKVQIDAVIALGRDILSRHAIAARNVVAHSDIAPFRKQDPGELFPWDRLAREGVGLWVETAGTPSEAEIPVSGGGEAVHRLRRSLASYGYGIGLLGPMDSEVETVLAAFQRHYRPSRVDGRADRNTLAVLDELLCAAGEAGLPAGAAAPAASNVTDRKSV